MRKGKKAAHRKRTPTEMKKSKAFSVGFPILPRPVSKAFYESGTWWARLLELFFAIPLRLCVFA